MSNKYTKWGTMFLVHFWVGFRYQWTHFLRQWNGGCFLVSLNLLPFLLAFADFLALVALAFFFGGCNFWVWWIVDLFCFFCFGLLAFSLWLCLALGFHWIFLFLLYCLLLSRVPLRFLILVLLVVAIVALRRFGFMARGKHVGGHIQRKRKCWQ